MSLCVCLFAAIVLIFTYFLENVRLTSNSQAKSAAMQIINKSKPSDVQ